MRKSIRITTDGAGRGIKPALRSVGGANRGVGTYPDSVLVRRNRRILDSVLRVSLVPEEGADRLLGRVLVLLSAFSLLAFFGISWCRALLGLRLSYK